uniref:Uncharacterized protein n=1 Tax=Oryza meridionalis TaxID=40149 RepID=A0A0E0EVH0_9ORYZ
MSYLFSAASIHVHHLFDETPLRVLATKATTDGADHGTGARTWLRQAQHPPDDLIHRIMSIL